MRRRSSTTELLTLAEPALRLADAVWNRMHWWVALLALLYLLSGVTLIGPDEVGIVLRWGRVVGATPALQEHGPGLLAALPRPIDRVLRIPTKRVFELSIDTLSDRGGQGWGVLDPVTQGYALTGDQNIVHVRTMVRYRIREAALWAFAGPPPEAILRVEATAAMMRSLGEVEVDSVLSDERQEFVEAVRRRTQEGLDRASSGLEIASLELTLLAPPVALSGEFDAVHSAFIQAETSRQEALAYAQSLLPGARTASEAAILGAQAEAAATVARARGSAAAFDSLLREQRSRPGAGSQRLYRQTIERVLARAGLLRWIPPPVGRNYQGLRLSLDSTPANPSPEAVLENP